jgi:membrane fusion protein, multidrug efflux system
LTDDVLPPRSAATHRRRNLLLVILLLAGAGLLVWYLTRADGRSGRDRGPPPSTVGVERATTQDVPVTLSAIGTVQPVVAATVRTQLAGTIFSIDFAEGQVVRRGQRLAQIDPRPYRLALAQVEGALARDQAQLSQARADLRRYETLLRQDSIARQQVDAQSALVGQLEGTLEADRAAVGTARLNLDYTAIKAPVSGRVGLRQADIGNYVTPGDANGIVVVTQDDPIDVSFAIPQDQLPRVQERARAAGGLPVTALDQAGSSPLGTGRFLTFDNAIDAATGTVRGKARFGNASGRLFPNQFVNVRLLVETLRGAVTVPVAAVRESGQGPFVFLVGPDRKAKLRRVKTGPTAAGRVVIAFGLKGGDTVVTEGADRIEDGADVVLPGDRPREGGRGEQRGRAGR